MGSPPVRASKLRKFGVRQQDTVTKHHREATYLWRSRDLHGVKHTPRGHLPMEDSRFAWCETHHREATYLWRSRDLHGVKQPPRGHLPMEESNMHAVKHTTARPPCSGHLQLERKKRTAKSHQAPDNNKRPRCAVMVWLGFKAHQLLRV